MASGSDSQFIEWDDERYSTNIERFDRQHQRLFELLNELHVAMNQGESDDEIRRILVELERYTEYHFGDEEEFMQDCGYSMDCSECFFNHREKHQEFAEKVTELREKHERGEYITMEVLMFVRDWLDTHIGGMNQDQSYGEYYEEEISDEYEYTPGKLKKDREVEAAHPEALQEETSSKNLDVTLDSDVHSGESLSVPDGSMAAWFDRVTSEHGGRSAAQFPTEDGMADRSFDRFFERAREVAAGLLEYGLEPGDRVGIYVDSGYQWSVVDMACYLAGVVSVPLSTLYSEERALHIVDDAGIDLVVAEPTIPVVVERQVETVVGVDPLPTGDPTDLPGYDRKGSNVATIVYKLGTDKHPRGCTLTHGNLLAGIEMLAGELPLDAGGVGTCFLPLAHIYQRVVGYYLWHTGNAAAYLDTEEFQQQLPAVQPDVFVGVPQAYESLHESIQSRMDELSGVKQLVAGDVASTYGEQMQDGESASAGLSFKRSIAEWAVLSSLREEFGLDGVEYALTGTESIDPELLQFFWGLGVPMREVYESTELTGLATITDPGEYRVDSVGSPFPGVEVALADDGEVLVRGPGVMDGYWDDSDATAYAIRDGWYHTGDIGEFDDDGSLRIVDSK
jgi:hemerythrin-like metal-binding protein